MRSCGACTLCCTVLRVDELRKLGGEPCRHLREPPEPPGCGIHPERPRICRRYRCLWLQGRLEEEDRPDRIGAVLDLLTSAGTTHLAVRLATPDVWERSPRLRAVAERFRAAMPVRITHGADVMDPDAPVRVLLPPGADPDGGDERRVEGDRVTVLREGRVVATRRLPWVQRAARRVMQGVQARRMRRWARRSEG